MINTRPFFWWSADGLSYPRKIIYWEGTDEFHWRTLGIRLPGGVLFLRLWFDYKGAIETDNLRTWGVPNPPEGLTGADLDEWNAT